MARRLRIHGRVQGVGFRYALLEEARRLTLTGWVRNRPDGTVEAVADGPAHGLDALVRWAHQGPPGAAVTRVEVCDEEGRYGPFEIRSTA